MLLFSSFWPTLACTIPTIICSHEGVLDPVRFYVGYCTSEAAPCPLQPCYFAKWDILANTLDYQYVMGFPVCIFNHFLPIFCILCHCLVHERDCPIFQKLFFPKIRILVQLLFSVSISKLAYYYLIIMLLFMGILFLIFWIPIHLKLPFLRLN